MTLPENLDKLTRKELGALCKKRKIRGFSTLNKPGILALLRASDTPAKPAKPATAKPAIKGPAAMRRFMKRHEPSEEPPASSARPDLAADCLRVNCPQCGAAPNVPCKGVLLDKVHEERALLHRRFFKSAKFITASGQEWLMPRVMPGLTKAVQSHDTQERTANNNDYIKLRQLFARFGWSAQIFGREGMAIVHNFQLPPDELKHFIRILEKTHV